MTRIIMPRCMWCGIPDVPRCPTCGEFSCLDCIVFLDEDSCIHEPYEGAGVKGDGWELGDALLKVDNNAEVPLEASSNSNLCPEGEKDADG